MTETPEDTTIKGRPVLKKAAAPAPKVLGDKTAPDDLDVAYAEIRKEPYVFTWSGMEFTLPHLGSLDYRLQLQIEQWDQTGVEEVMTLFSKIFGEEQAAAWAEVEVPTPVLFMLFERWLAHSGAKLGEEPASSDSSGSTGKSSRRTSGRSTTSGSPKPSTAKRAPRKAASPLGNSST
jgi:hypothetical protein